MNYNFETAYEAHQNIMAALRTHNTVPFNQFLRVTINDN
ncbi:hypothetical protein Nizo2259_0156 [Lactiplantibacillus plantarum]|nr:hypothetical protein FBR6_2516 [Lactiplantibacillus plantarum]KZT99651.1 hypothetical protein Nizo2259_0156 [Lactiplantibacillus plantarum]KZU20902.1 hypothetical protein Nizo2484_1708 [Lactiplantibacillus plantarum]KZU22923.1 hypothetical protein Nizo2485_2727 [Lactiplantibacillus plantarum]